MKYGIKYILRTPVRSILFLILIGVIAVFLTLGTGIFWAAENMLDEADETFITAGEFVYTQGNYPDDSVYDAALADAYASFSLADCDRDEVLMIEQNLMQRAGFEGYKPKREDMPYSEFAVLSVSVRYYYEELDAWYAIVTDSHYSEKDMEGSIIYIAADEGIQLEARGKYIISGTYTQIIGKVYVGFDLISEDNMLSFIPEDFSSAVDVEKAGGEEDFWESGAGKSCLAMIDDVRVMNHAVDVAASGNIEAVSTFHTGEYTLIEGEYFTADDYEDGGVCVIPSRAASQLGLSVGDTITLSLHYPTEQESRYDSYKSEEGIAGEFSYTIVGIYQADSTNTPVYIPDTGNGLFSHSVNDYTLGRVILDNRTAGAYMEEIEKILPESIELSIYDQGYQAAVTSIINMQKLSAMIVAACLLATVLVLWFFSYFYIYRNNNNIRILFALGAGSARVRIFLLTGMGHIAVMASTLGSLCGYFISGHVIASVYQYVEESSVYDFRYSIIGYGIKTDQFTAVPVREWLSSFWAAAGICLVSLLINLVMIQLVLNKQKSKYQLKKLQTPIKNKQKKNLSPKQALGEKGCEKMPFISLRYSVRSILRQGKRSLTVPLVFTVLLFCLCTFTSIKEGFYIQREQTYTDIPVTMYNTDISGRQVDNLLINRYEIEDMNATGFVSESWESSNYGAMYMGIVSYADGTEADLELDSFDVPGGSFAFENFLHQWSVTSTPFTLIDNVERAPEFFYSSDTQITWMEGFSADIYAAAADGYQQERYCVAPAYFMEEKEVNLGDSIALVIPLAEGCYYQCAFTIIGSYTSRTGSGAIYAPQSTILQEQPSSMDVYVNESGYPFDIGTVEEKVTDYEAFLSEEVYMNILLPENISVSLSSDEATVMLSASGDTSLLALMVPASAKASEYAAYLEDILEAANVEKGYVSISLGYRMKVNAAGFLLQNTEKLSDLKDWMESRYDRLGIGGTNRRWAIIDDEALYSTIETLTRYIDYMEMLYPLIFVLIAGIGFLVSNLLLKSRISEITILRSMGEGRPGIFFSFFLEPLFLSVPGILIGLAVSYALWGSQTDYLKNSIIFALCYYIGTTLAILQTFRKAIMKHSGDE